MTKKNNEIKKTIDKAVALSYSQDDRAPKVIAKGLGVVANNIVKKAKEENVTIYSDPNLINTLIGLEVNEEIPEELYEVVAEIIFYVYNLDSQRGSLND